MRSWYDVGDVGWTPSDLVLLDMRCFHYDNLASRRVDLGVLDAVEGESAETGAVEHGVCVREVRLTDVGEFSTDEGDTKTLEVLLEV